MLEILVDGNIKMNLLLEDQRKLLPMLTVFTALFRYILIAADDSDFARTDNGEINLIIFRSYEKSSC